MSQKSDSLVKKFQELKQFAETEGSVESFKIALNAANEALMAAHEPDQPHHLPTPPDPPKDSSEVPEMPTKSKDDGSGTTRHPTRAKVGPDKPGSSPTDKAGIRPPQNS